MLERAKIGTFARAVCLWVGAGTMLCLGGCTRQAKDTPVRICPGKANVQEALGMLRSQMLRIKSLHISGKCRMGFFDQKGEKREYNLPVSLFLEPPFNLYLYGQPAVGPRGAVSLGSNQEEFWLSVKPDINTLWWGKWEEASQVGDLRVSPRVVLEALGMVDFEDPSRWRLENRDGYDILSEVDSTDSIVKQVFVNPCDYLVYQISYLDDAGMPRAVVKLDGYVQVSPEFSMPTDVRVDNYLGEELTDWLELSIRPNAIREKEFSDQQRARMFNRPQDRGYDSVIHVTDAGQILEN